MLARRNTAGIWFWEAEQAPEMYKVWRDKKDNVTKIVIDPWAGAVA